jgi:CO/xanthine dehydrogenase Mo-binding subunit
MPVPSARRLVAGGGRYVANISSPGMLHAAFTRSVWPHATIRAIDPRPALAVPRVRAVFSLSDLEAEFVETPTPRTATGARGAGELGIIGPAAAIAGAIADALGPDLQAPARTPMTPERVWRLLMAPRTD